MTKYVKAYLEYIRKIAESGDVSEEILREHLRQIEFIQHERLIHLLVTILFAVIFFISLIGCFIADNPVFILLSVLLLALLIPYIAHYYFLENSTQELYRLYNKMRGSKW